MFLFELEFDCAFVESISKNTRFYLKQKLEMETMASGWVFRRHRRRSGFILHMIFCDITSVFLEAEKQLSQLQTLSKNIRKMNYEISGFLKQSKVAIAKNFLETEQPAPTIDAQLRKALHEIPEVCGVGVIYGKLEIHIDYGRKYKAILGQQENVTNVISEDNSMHGDQKMPQIKNKDNLTVTETWKTVETCKPNLGLSCPTFNISERPKTKSESKKREKRKWVKNKKHAKHYRQRENDRHAPLVYIPYSDTLTEQTRDYVPNNQCDISKDNNINLVEGIQEKEAETHVGNVSLVSSNKEVKTDTVKYDIILPPNLRQEISTVIDVEATKKKIHSTIVRFRFPHRYSIKYVEKEAEPLSKGLKPGVKVFSKTINSRPQIGTLGGFYESSYGFCGLTCAHVIGTSKSVSLEENGAAFGHALKMCSAGDVEQHFVDIAVLKLNPDVEKKCKERLRRDLRKVSLLPVSRQLPTSLCQRRVHKFGAFTGFTKGVIVSDNYSRFFSENNAEKYLILVDHVSNVSGNSTTLFHSLARRTSVMPRGRLPDMSASASVGNSEMRVERNIQQSESASFQQPHAITVTSNNTDGHSEEQLIDSDDIPEHMYVRDCTFLLEKYTQDTRERSKYVFGSEGDSGSVICLDPDVNSVTSTALSMLSHGNFTVREQNGETYISYTISFTLASGLNALRSVNES